jgi:hypothetical protein
MIGIACSIIRRKTPKKQLIGQTLNPAGTSNVIALVETAPAVPWTKPEDVLYDSKKSVPKFGGVFQDGFCAAFFDGSVKYIMEITETDLRILLNPASTKAVGPYKSRGY